jgi:hypothetical protein
MAFCENCGIQLSDAAKFCGSCGKPILPGVAALPSTPPERRGTRSRLILGTVIVLVVLGCVGIGAGFYVFHRVTTKTDELTQGLPAVSAIATALQGPGSQLPATPPSPASNAPPQGLDENKIVKIEDGQCSLFNKEELTRVLETHFTHADADATGCIYKGEMAREWVRTEALWKGGHKLVKEKSDTYAGLRQSMVNQHYTKADIDSHVFPIAPYPGAGDEAYVNLVNMVTARKGDVGIIMDLRYYHDSDDITKMLTNAALSRLAGG